MLLNKKNRAYYLCHLIGVLLYYLILTPVVNQFGDKLAALSLSESIWDFFWTLCLVVLIPHFIIRHDLKKQTGALTIVSFFTIIFKASLLNTIIVIFINVLEYTFFDFNLSMNLIVAFEQGEFLARTLQIALNGLIIYFIWVTFYLAITLTRDKKRLKQKLTEQRLVSLINQINPHFLFNSLNTIRGMIFENEKNAVKLISQLSNLFRYNLASNKTGITHLRKELAVCEQYLAIEEIRLGDRLQIEFVIAPETLDMKIPTMGLLTLTENAIKHGIAKLNSGGVLTIKSEKINNKLILSVGNPYDVELVESGTQIGLDNLKQRIELMYGNQGQVVQDSVDGYFQVKLIIPAEVMVTDDNADISLQNQDVQAEAFVDER